MADDPKIVLDPPPAQPVDVKVNPDPPPAQPIDVQVTPDPGPRAPIDIRVVPDGPPARTFDVPVSLDPGPKAPIDVNVSPDPAPAVPFPVPTPPDPAPRAPVDVPTVLDPAPKAPVNVPTVLDPGPLAPVDVPTPPDPPPTVPFNVPTPPDLPPAVPFDVPTVPDLPPAAPFDVATAPDTPPADPFDVPTFPDPPPELVKGGVNGETTIQSIIKAVKDFDGPLGAFLASLETINPISLSVQGGGGLDPFALARWFKDYTSVVGGVGVARFVAEQTALYAMNPVTARIFDPTYFLKMLIPGSPGNITTTVDVETGTTAKTVALAREQTLTGLVHANRFRPAGDGRSGINDVYGPENTFLEGQDFSVDEMVDAAIDGKPHPFLQTKDDGLATPIKRFDAGAYFQDRDSFGGMAVRGTTRARAVNAEENLISREAALAQSTFINGVVRAAVGPNEDADGCVYSRTQNPGDLVDDDDARVPLCFTDLRKDPMRNAYRSIFFRPLDLGFTKSVSPEWNEAGAFGRTDPIVGYQKTVRSYSISFTVMAFAGEDLELIWKKMVWLDSLCYPSFGPDSLFQSGPVVQVRVGDAVSTESGGLPGILKGLNFDFSEVMWELKKGFKVPRSYKASVEFLVLHEGPVGLFNGSFGVYQLPPNTAFKQDNSPDANSGGTVPAQQSQEETPRTAQVLPGRFSKFGEPRR